MNSKTVCSSLFLTQYSIIAGYCATPSCIVSFEFLVITFSSYIGTPQGVGPVKIGQRIDAGITALLDVHFDVERRQRVRH